MVFPVRVTFVLLLLGSTAGAGLQIVPETIEYELEGIKFHQLAFPDSEQSAPVKYAPPRGWRYSTRASQLLLEPSRVPEAEGIIRVVKLPHPQVLDEPTIKNLCEEATTSIPGGATNVTIVSQQKNPMLIEKKETALVVINYEFYGVPYTRSVMFLDRGNEQVQFQLTSPRAKFSELQKEFMASHFTWQNL